jgi:TMEM175 potassium channel family protein
MTRNPDRLVLFTDAVVAIAVTLLILPLVEVVTEARSENLDAQALIDDHWAQIWSFLLSFVVITRFWLTHHRMFEHVKAYNSRLIQLNMLWLLSIVVLPFPTEIIGTYESSSFVAGLYVGNLLALSIFQLAMTLLIRGHEELEQESDPVTRADVIGAANFAVLSAIAFVLAAFVPGVRFYALLLLILTAFDGVVGRFTKKSAQQPA